MTPLLFSLLTIIALQADATGTAVAQPTGEVVYREDTDTYYQIFEFFGSPPYSWEHAQFTVKGYRHKGREGFLAKIPDAMTHYFVLGSLRQLRAQPAWIGMAFRCEEGVAVASWDDGDLLKDQSFRAWAPNVGRKTRDACRGRMSSDAIPVYYNPTDLGTRWEVASGKGNIQYLLVAFPPPEDVASNP